MRSQSSSPNRPGMERQGTHLYSLPSASRNRGSTSTLDSSVDSQRSSASPDIRSVPLAASSRSSLAELSTQEDPIPSNHDWSLLSIERVRNASGMVLVALYHLPTATLYTWPLQTDPQAPQPKQGTVFIASRNGSDDTANENVTSESLKVLTRVLLTWMKFGAGRCKVKTKLGERSDDTEWLRNTLQMPRIRSAEKRAILNLQIVRPLREWSGAVEAEATRKSGKGNNVAVLGSLNTNVGRLDHHNALHLTETSSLDKMPSIEVTSPNTSDLLSRRNAPWLAPRSPNYVL
ncbi:hypothetical protein CBS101457_003352 [Exobasidium rhododendri]|nr:hypothetical protein CBS101457_003352 [Exobasidium rhododendri]